MLAPEIPLLASQPGHCDSALPFQEPNRDTHMHRVRQEAPFDDLTFFLSDQSVENLPQLTARLPEDCFESHWSNQWLTLNQLG